MFKKSWPYCCSRQCSSVSRLREEDIEDRHRHRRDVASHEMVDESKNIVGFDIDLMSAAAKAGGFEVEFKNTAWDGIFAGLEGSKYDAVMSSVTITTSASRPWTSRSPTSTPARSSS